MGSTLFYSHKSVLGKTGLSSYQQKVINLTRREDGQCMQYSQYETRADCTAEGLSEVSVYDGDGLPQCF